MPFSEDLYKESDKKYQKEENYAINCQIVTFIKNKMRANKFTRWFDAPVTYWSEDNSGDPVECVLVSFDETLNWSVIKGMLERYIQDGDLGLKTCTVTIKEEPFTHTVQDKYNDFWGRPKYHDVPGEKYEVWVRASW